MNLRSRLIRLAYEKPELRTALLPVLAGRRPECTECGRPASFSYDGVPRCGTEDPDGSEVRALEPVRDEVSGRVYAKGSLVPSARLDHIFPVAD